MDTATPELYVIAYRSTISLPGGFLSLSVSAKVVLFGWSLVNGIWEAPCIRLLDARVD